MAYGIERTRQNIEGRFSLSMSKRLPSNFTIRVAEVKQGKFTITIPVFNVRRAWDALRISNSKLVSKGKNNIKNIIDISANPTTSNLYVCVYEFESELDKNTLTSLLKWNVYKQ